MTSKLPERRNRKLRKLVRNPGLFLKDFAAKRGRYQESFRTDVASLAAQVAELKKSNDSLKKSVDASNRTIDATAKFALNSMAALTEVGLLRDLLSMSDRFTGHRDSSKFIEFAKRFSPHLAAISDSSYDRLDEEDKATYRRWLLKRYAKIDALDEGELESYEKAMKKVRAIPLEREFENQGTKYQVKSLRDIGYDLEFIRTSDYVLVNDFYLKQYRHKDVFVKEGDIVIDAGAYTGDTAMVFGHNTNYTAEIHSFELSQANIDCFEANLELTPQLRPNVTINRLALTKWSGDTVKFDEGEHEDSVFSAFKIGDKGVEVQTVTIDDYVASTNLNRVDFIKMDIEGAERDALEGARSTISKHKPRLAISLYHIWDDTFVIPQMLNRMHGDYVYYFNWYNKQMANEAVLYAIDRHELQRQLAQTQGQSTTNDVRDAGPALPRLSRLS